MEKAAGARAEAATERVAETALETVAETAEGAPRTSGRCKADC